MSLKWIERSVWIVVVVTLIMGAIFVVPGEKKTTTVHRIGPAGLASFVPSPATYCIHNSTGIVHSYYSYESGLTGGSPPIDDIDSMLPAGAHDAVCVPGDERDRYTYYGAVEITGSGIAELWATPNGGRFAYVHMYTVSVGASAPKAVPPSLLKQAKLVKPPKCQTVEPCNFGDSDSNTARLVAALFAHTARAGIATYPGGRYVGLSGWPSSYEFSNGSCGDLYSCRIDAHLCVVLDSAADAYFAYIASRPPKPTFHLKVWNQYRVKHKKKLISPYVNKRGTLTFPASIWLYHQKLCQGVVNGGVWHAKGQVMVQRWQGCTVWFWPHRPNWKPKITKSKFLR